jgi:hypothetical protein
MNNTNAIFLAIGIAAVLAVALVPSLGNDASAAKRVECTNGGGNDKPCSSPATKNVVCTNPEGKRVSCGNLDD